MKELTNDEKRELLLKDICGRLFYFLKANINGEVVWIDSWCDDDGNFFNFLTDGEESNFGEGFSIEDIKPYLRPMSSMTDLERKQLSELLDPNYYIDSDYALCVKGGGGVRLDQIEIYNDFLNTHYLDYRGLIRMGMALEAEKGMYLLPAEDGMGMYAI